MKQLLPVLQFFLFLLPYGYITPGVHAELHSSPFLNFEMGSCGVVKQSRLGSQSVACWGVLLDHLLCQIGLDYYKELLFLSSSEAFEEVELSLETIS